MVVEMFPYTKKYLFHREILRASKIPSRFIDWHNFVSISPPRNFRLYLDIIYNELGNTSIQFPTITQPR